MQVYFSHMAFEKMNSAGYLINHAARLFAEALREQIAPLGIAPAQFMALLELWREDGLTQKDLIQRLDVEQATMANTISRMERDGLIVRRSHADDKRSRRIYVTPKAKAIEAAAIEAAKSVNQSFLSTLPVDEQPKLIELLRQIVVTRSAPDTSDTQGH